MIVTGRIRSGEREGEKRGGSVRGSALIVIITRA
jgi:hypothetical protein